MKIKHYNLFKTNFDILNWEYLRNNSNEGPYHIPNNKLDYISKAESSNYNDMAIAIIKYCNSKNLNKIFSFGSGIALLEYHIKKLSNFKVIVSDYNDSIYRIDEFKIFDAALKIDLLKDQFTIEQGTLLLFPRIDTEFTNNQLKNIFHKLSTSTNSDLLFIPAELLTIRIFLAEIKILLISIIKNNKRVFCGYARSRIEFIKLWNSYYHYTKFMGFRGIFLLKNKL